MKLFVGAYEAAGTFPVAMYLYTEEDVRIEANRASILKRKGAKKLLWYVNSCELYGKFEGGNHVFICVDLDYQGQRRRHYNNLPDKTADKFLKEGEL
jgi:hypothetical protein